MGYAHIENLYKCQDILMFRECYATEKIHGCLESETQLETKDGIKTIKDICETKYVGKVKTYNLNTNKLI